MAITRLAASATNTTGFTNPNNILSSTDTGAAATYSLAAKNTTGTKLRLNNFGFDALIPVGTGIVSVRVDVRQMVDTTGSIAFLENALNIGATAGATNSDSGEPTSLTTDTYSAYARPGGGGWTRADLLDGTLTADVWLRTGNSANAVTASFDWFTITVETVTNDDATPAADGIKTAASGVIETVGVIHSLDLAPTVQRVDVAQDLSAAPPQEAAKLSEPTLTVQRLGGNLAVGIGQESVRGSETAAAVLTPLVTTPTPEAAKLSEPTLTVQRQTGAVDLTAPVPQEAVTLQAADPTVQRPSTAPLDAAPTESLRLQEALAIARTPLAVVVTNERVRGAEGGTVAGLGPGALHTRDLAPTVQRSAGVGAPAIDAYPAAETLHVAEGGLVSGLGAGQLHVRDGAPAAMVETVAAGDLAVAVATERLSMAETGAVELTSPEGFVLADLAPTAERTTVTVDLTVAPPTEAVVAGETATAIRIDLGDRTVSTSEALVLQDASTAVLTPLVATPTDALRLAAADPTAAVSGGEATLTATPSEQLRVSEPTPTVSTSGAAVLTAAPTETVRESDALPTAALVLTPTLSAIVAAETVRVTAQPVSPAMGLVVAAADEQLRLTPAPVSIYVGDFAPVGHVTRLVGVDVFVSAIAAGLDQSVSVGAGLEPRVPATAGLDVAASVVAGTDAIVSLPAGLDVAVSGIAAGLDDVR